MNYKFQFLIDDFYCFRYIYFLFHSGDILLSISDDHVQSPTDELASKNDVFDSCDEDVKPAGNLFDSRYLFHYKRSLSNYVNYYIFILTIKQV